MHRLKRRSFSRSLHYAYHTFLFHTSSGVSLEKTEGVDLCNTYHKSVVLFPASFCLPLGFGRGLLHAIYKLVSHHVNRVELSIILSKGKPINYPSSSNTLSTVFSKTNVIVPPCISAIGRTFISAHSRSKSTADKRLSDVDLGTSRSSGSKSWRRMSSPILSRAVAAKQLICFHSSRAASATFFFSRYWGWDSYYPTSLEKCNYTDRLVKLSKITWRYLCRIDKSSLANAIVRVI